MESLLIKSAQSGGGVNSSLELLYDVTNPSTGNLTIQLTKEQIDKYRKFIIIGECTVRSYGVGIQVSGTGSLATTNKIHAYLMNSNLINDSESVILTSLDAWEPTFYCELVIVNDIWLFDSIGRSTNAVASIYKSAGSMYKKITDDSNFLIFIVKKSASISKYYGTIKLYGVI